jgi:propionate CoA-transferase
MSDIKRIRNIFSLSRKLQFYSSSQIRSFGSRSKVVNVEDAVNLICNYDTISVSGFVAQSTPETLLRALGNRYRQSGQPANLELVFGGGPGDFDNRGLNHLAQTGMLKRVIGGHYGQVPLIAKMALNNEIEAYCMPMGSISRMLRAAASASPGHISKVGFGTFIDPAITGGRLNAKSVYNVVEKITIMGEDYLLYKAIPIQVGIIRATTADHAGNLSFEKESIYSDARIIAMAARSSGGVVLAQVERLAETSTIPMRSVHIPGALVDCVVVAEKEADTWQSFFTKYNPAWSGEIREPMRENSGFKPSLPDERKIIARRAALELRQDQVVNLGIGMPEGVADVAREENFFQFTTLTTEAGVFGGVGAGGHDFGPASCPDALMEINQQFDFYNGGGLDICFLGLAQCGANGDVNVSRLSKGKLTGPGGFIDISQCTPRVIFMGTFRKKDFQMELKQAHVDVESGNNKVNNITMNIIQEGAIPTFQRSVSEITFSSQNALKRGQRVLYITERAVFQLTHRGLKLIEIAPGVDIDKDILQQMDFMPVVDRDQVTIMNEKIFSDKKMGLVEYLLDPSKTINSRVEYNAESNTLYIDLSGLVVNDEATMKSFFNALESKYKNVSNDGAKRFNCVANYNGFSLVDSLVESWQQTTDYFNRTYYLSHGRYGGRAFVRHKLATMISVQNEDEMWTAFQQGKSDATVLDRMMLREGLLSMHHLRADERLMNTLMNGKDVISRKEFPILLQSIKDYEMGGQVELAVKD